MNPKFQPSPRFTGTPVRRLPIATAIPLLLLGLLATKASAEVQIAVGSALAEPGDRVDIPLIITTDVGVAAIQLDISFDPSHLTVGAPIAGDVFSDHQVVSHASSEGVLRMVVYSLTNDTLGTGTLVTLPFTVAPTSPEGQFVLEVSAATLADPEALAAPPNQLLSGTIRVGIGFIFVDDFESGDVSAWSRSVPGFPSIGVLAVPLKPSRGARVEKLLSPEHSVYQAAFRFDPYRAVMREGDFYTIFAAYQNRAAAPVFAIEFGFLGGQHVLRARVRIDRGFYLESGEWPIANDEYLISIAWWASPPDEPNGGGGLRLLLNGEPVFTLDGLENANHRLRALRMGAFDGGDSAGQGTILFGDYKEMRFRKP